MRIYTTGEVSKICNVATTTVNKWFDSGRLQGFRVPGSRHRRIPQSNLVAFLRDHGVPLGQLADAIETTVLVVTRDRDLARGLEAQLSAESGLHLVFASSGFEAGLRADSAAPDCVVVDFDIGQVEARQMCQNMRRSANLAETILVALVPRGNLAHHATDAIDERFEKPLDPGLLAQRIRRLTSSRPRRPPTSSTQSP